MTTTPEQKIEDLAVKAKMGDVKSLTLFLDLGWPLNKPRDFVRHPIRAFRVSRFMKSLQK